jgi:hypothetical protein
VRVPTALVNFHNPRLTPLNGTKITKADTAMCSAVTSLFQGCVFDVPTELADTLLQQWKDGRNDTLTIATELPELLKPEKSSTFDFGNGRSSFGGGRGGYGAGRGRGGNGYGNDRRRESWGSGRGNTGRGGGASGWSRDFNRNGLAKRKGGASDGYPKNNRTTFEQ